MRKLFLAVAIILFATSAMADVKIGSAKYYWRGLIHAYDATLSSPDGTYDPNKQFTLELVYQTDIDGSDIAEKSIDEMDDIEKLDKEKSAKWLAEMKAIFPNVKDGTSLKGTNKPGKGVVFSKDGQNIGEIKDPEFAKRFFGIWLDERTSDKKFRAKLLGEK